MRQLITIFNDSVPLGELIIFSDDDVFSQLIFLQTYWPALQKSSIL